VYYVFESCPELYGVGSMDISSIVSFGSFLTFYYFGEGYIKGCPFSPRQRERERERERGREISL
jgi:hypothetical protein